MGYDDERWNRAHARWVENLRATGTQNSPIEDVSIPIVRVCPGCGVDFMLNGVQIKHHPDPLDPWALCDTCSVERSKPFFEKLRETSKLGPKREAYWKDQRILLMMELKHRRSQIAKDDSMARLDDNESTQCTSLSASDNSCYDRLRHESAVAKWEADRYPMRRWPIYSTGALKAAKDSLGLDEPDREESRECQGCGNRFTLMKVQLLAYPDPSDPHPLCPSCEIGREIPIVN